MSHDPSQNPKEAKEAGLVPVKIHELRYMTPQEAARERLKHSVDSLGQQVSLKANMEKEPLKILGGASAVGAVLGLALGSSLRRSKKIYVDADSPLKHQKALVRAQKKSSSAGAGGALVATLGTWAVKLLVDQVVQPKLQDFVEDLKRQQALLETGTAHLPQTHLSHRSGTETLGNDQTNALPASEEPKSSPIHTFLKPVHPGVVAMPESQVEAKAIGTPIEESERRNPNE